MRAFSLDRLAAAGARREEETVRAEAIGALFVLGGLVGAISLVLPHEADGEPALWALAAGAALLGLVLMLLGEHVTTPVVHGVVAIAAVMINAAILVSGIAAGLYALFFTWIAILAAYFFPLRAALIHVAWMLVLYAAVLAALDASVGFSALTRWIVSALTLLIAVGVAATLVKRREHAEREMRVFFEHSLDMLCTADADGHLVTLNGGWERVFGWSKEELRARPFIEFVHPEDREATTEMATRQFAGEKITKFENRYLAKDGSYRWLLWSAQVAPGEKLIYAHATDITYRKELQHEREALLAEAERSARTDHLTGLPNRRWLDDELTRQIARSERQGFQLCAAMLDLDHFKQYNDRHGHSGGDRLLVEATEAWRRAVRVSDFLGRYGGEEFFIVMPDCPADRALSVMERVKDATPRGETCSIGVACWSHGERPESLIHRADMAMYEAKRAGRNRVSLHEQDRVGA